MPPIDRGASREPFDRARGTRGRRRRHRTTLQLPPAPWSWIWRMGLRPPSSTHARTTRHSFCAISASPRCSIPRETPLGQKTLHGTTEGPLLLHHLCVAAMPYCNAPHRVMGLLKDSDEDLMHACIHPQFFFWDANRTLCRKVSNLGLHNLCGMHLALPDLPVHRTCTALKSRSARLLPEGTLDAAPPPMPMRYAGPPILTMSMPTSGSSFFRWLWSIWPRPPLQAVCHTTHEAASMCPQAESLPW